MGGVSGVLVIECMVGLLGRNAYTAINMLAQMAPLHPSSPSLLLRLLRESGRAQMNVIEVNNIYFYIGYNLSEFVRKVADNLPDIQRFKFPGS